MRIINGRDYYDTAMGYGIDKSIVFVRQKEFEIKREELPSEYFRLPDNNLQFNFPEMRSIQIHFCGKLYLGLMAYLRPFKGWEFPNKPYVFWDIEDLLKTYAKYGWTINKNTERQLEQYYSFSGKERDRDLLIRKRITIAILDLSQYYYGQAFWTIDGFNLQYYQFAKVFDPFSAFQEISMWVGGVLPKPGVQPPQIVDEEIRIAKRGFHPKWSFRREKK